MTNIQRDETCLVDISNWFETLPLTSGLVTGLPFSNVDDIHVKDGGQAAALR